MVRLLISIKRWYLERQLRSAIRKADMLAKRSGARYLVLRYRGGFLVKRKSELKRLIKSGYFASGFNIQTAERIALYKTSSPCS